MNITTFDTTTAVPTHGIDKALTDPATHVPTAFWVPENVTINKQAGTVAATWLGWFSREAFDAAAQPANAGVYPRPTTQIAALPPEEADLCQWVCQQAVTSAASTNPMNASAANQFAGGKVAKLPKPA